SRPVSGDASDLTRAETVVHVQVTWLAPLKSRWQLAIAGGPSWFMVDQDLVTGVSVAETYPYDTAVYSGGASARRAKSKLGFNAGADLDCMIRRRVGLGIGVGFSHASVPLSDVVSANAGGVHVGGGVRFRF